MVPPPKAIPPAPKIPANPVKKKRKKKTVELPPQTVLPPPVPRESTKAIEDSTRGRKRS